MGSVPEPGRAEKCVLYPSHPPHWTPGLPPTPNGQTQDIQSQPANQTPAQPKESIGQRFITNDGYIGFINL